MADPITVYSPDQLQGNVFPGFRAPSQAILLFSIIDPDRFRLWLRENLGSISTARQVREGTGPFLNIGFTAAGLRRLDLDPQACASEAFAAGFAARLREGEWVFHDDGSVNDAVHACLILADANRAEVYRGARSLQAQITWGRPVGYRNHILPGLEIGGYETSLDALEGSQREHFGFTDGLTNPLVLAEIDRPLPLFLAAHLEEVGRSGRALEGGRLVVDPSHLFLGPTHDPEMPAWCRGASFLVFGRYRQYVGRFHRALSRIAEVVLGRGITEGDEAVLERIASRFNGRWPSGAPVVFDQVPETIREALDQDDFWFSRSTEQRVEIGGRTQVVRIAADPTGAACPFAAHVRAMNPREAADLSDRPALMRRGAPYGPRSRSTPFDPDGDQVDRGLHFLAYTTRIAEEFEKAHNRGAAARPSDADALLSCGGTCSLGSDYGDLPNRSAITDRTVDNRLVELTGGSYFVCCTMSGLRDMAAR